MKDAYPSVSPDGSTLLFQGQIFMASPDGETIKQVTTGVWSNVQPSIAPDGRTLFTYRHLEGDGYKFGHLAAYALD